MSFPDILAIAGVSTLGALLLGFVTMCPTTLGRWLRGRRDSPRNLDGMLPTRRRGGRATDEADLRYIGQ